MRFVGLALISLFATLQLGESSGHGGVLLLTNGHKRKHGNNLIIIGGTKNCGPTMIKTHGKKHKKKKDIIIVGGCKEMKKEVKKVEYIALPYVVKEYVPIHMPMKKSKSMAFDMFGFGDMGLASNNRVQHAEPNEQDDPDRTNQVETDDYERNDRDQDEQDQIEQEHTTETSETTTIVSVKRNKLKKTRPTRSYITSPPSK